MDAISLLQNRAAAVATNVHALVGDLGDLDVTTPVVPGTSPLGLTLWHIPRTQDWVVNTCIRGVPEVADAFRDGLPDPDTYGFGTGLSAEQACAAAAGVHLPTLLEYADAVAVSVDQWLASVDETDLEVVPPLKDRQGVRAPYTTSGALAEIEGLHGASVGVLLLRPALGHLFWHLGEADVLIQMAKATTAPG